MTNRQHMIGIGIVIAGVVILLGKWGVFSFIGSVFWPLFILVPGLVLQFLFFSRLAPSAILIPAGILTTYGLLFLICNGFGWHLMLYLWPIFILGVAVGLYEYYAFGERDRSVWTAALVLGIVSLALLSLMLLWTIGIYFVALILIVVGLWLVFSNKKRTW